MNKVIKFRAWDKERKVMREVVEMVFGVYQKKDFPNTIILSDGNENYSSNADRCDLMQYTGLKDKHGKEIYEGDVVRGDFKLLYEVIFTKGEYRIGNDGLYKYLSSVEVIGNVWENPELLETEGRG